jgi:hypothetical protein
LVIGRRSEEPEPGGAKRVQASLSLYQTLQIDPRAEDIVIRAAYRALMKRHHPDHGGDTATAQRLSRAYATLANPVARRAYDLLRGVPTPPAAPQDWASPASPETPPRGATRSLMAQLREPLSRRFKPVAAQGPLWLFDFAGQLAPGPCDRVLIKSFERGDGADARAFQMRIEATRLLRPIWTRGCDVFVAVLPQLTGVFTALLRAPRGPMARLSYAVVTIDLSMRRLHAVGSTARLRAFEALAAALDVSPAASC